MYCLLVRSSHCDHCCTYSKQRTPWSLMLIPYLANSTFLPALYLHWLGTLSGFGAASHKLLKKQVDLWRDTNTAKPSQATSIASRIMFDNIHISLYFAMFLSQLLKPYPWFSPKMFLCPSLTFLLWTCVDSWSEVCAFEYPLLHRRIFVLHVLHHTQQEY